MKVSINAMFYLERVKYQKNKYKEKYLNLVKGLKVSQSPLNCFTEQLKIVLQPKNNLLKNLKEDLDK